MQNGAQLVRYDAMVTAIIACHSVDELKDLHDKALALELYAKQAKNTDAERKAADVRLRAERRTGELLKELARTPREESGRAGGKGQPTTESPYAAALNSSGISPQTANRYQALAEVPHETFEAHLADPVRKPTTNRIISDARDPPPKLDDKALWIWGRARDFERDSYIAADPAVLLEGMTETMRADMRRIVPLLVDFYQRMQEVL